MCDQMISARNDKIQFKDHQKWSENYFIVEIFLKTAKT